ncbi:MAG: hypothetical protein AB7P49_18490 [Bdellovibrionales bacterium]
MTFQRLPPRNSLRRRFVAGAASGSVVSVTGASLKATSLDGKTVYGALESQARVLQFLFVLDRAWRMPL